MIDVGDVLGGDVRLDEKVGEGGFGAVFRATQLGLNRTVAVKALLTDNVPSLEIAMKSFKKEADVLSSLKHEQIPAIHTIGTHEGTPYLVMEWLDGRSFYQRIAQDGPLSEGAALRTIAHLTRPLALAHAQGVLHRDLKPGNIIETKDGSIKLIDFGIAKHFGPAAERGRRKPTADTSGLVMGTWAYIAPEQARGERASIASDIYALGAVLYHLLAGQPPFYDTLGAANGLAVLVGVSKNESPTDLRKITEDRPYPVKDSIAELVNAMMATNPAARPPSMKAVEVAIQAIYDDRSGIVRSSPTDMTAANSSSSLDASAGSAPTAAGKLHPPRRRTPAIVSGVLAFGVATGVVGFELGRHTSPSVAGIVAPPPLNISIPKAAPAVVPTAPAATTESRNVEAAPVQTPTPTPARHTKRRSGASPPPESTKQPPSAKKLDPNAPPNWDDQ